MKKLGRHTKFWIIAAIIVLIVVLYYSSGFFFIFNNDAYVDANWVRVSPIVSGPIAKVHIKDNQVVQKNETLLSLLATPFEIAVNKAQSQLDQANAKRGLILEQIKESQANLEVEKAKLKLASDDFKRYSKLVKDGSISKEHYDEKVELYNIAKAEYASAEQTLTQSVKQLDVSDADIKEAKSELALAKYDLAQSVIKAPFEGIVNNLRVYKGDYAKAGDTLFGLIDTNSWRVTANIKESNLVGIKEGKQVWLYLSSHPWKLYRGEIDSIGRGVARSAVEQDSAMPYIKPVTDWIRYDYRIPVRIRFVDLPSIEKTLHVGADVKVFIF